MSAEMPKMIACAECGMPCDSREYHPFAACLMFKTCHSSDTVRANLEAIKQEATRQAMEQVLEILHDENGCCETGISFAIQRVRALSDMPAQEVK